MLNNREYHIPFILMSVGGAGRTVDQAATTNGRHAQCAPQNGGHGDIGR